MPRYQRRQTYGENGQAGSRFLVQISVMLDADIGKPTGPDTGEGQKSFLLTGHPLLQTQPLAGQHSFGRRFLLFAPKCHSCPHYRSIATRLRRWTMRAARRRAVRRRSDSMSSTLPCRWTEIRPGNPFNREEGINNPSLVCRSLLKAITSEHGLKNSRVSRRTQPARLPLQDAQKDRPARPQGVGRLRRTRRVRRKETQD